ncbi:DNA-directed RNA polymerase subunit alpha C-terminal domain-containing protein [Nonomuraea sp. NPDC049141]|uniref:DNA-directed RNA polymerase subunit alpha C-terminal domain-containing protein n=1 Tax=Nonomuraea sp. NPDC049141 TaxID=3155500 RepID=UPI0033D41DA0
MSITDTTADTRTINDLVKATGLPGNTDISLLLPEGLTVRAHNCMKRDDIHTLDQLAEHDNLTLTDIRNFGAVCLDNVRTVLSRQASRYALILKAAPPWHQEIVHLAGVLSNGYDQDLINRVLGELTDTAPGYLLCVWELRDASVYCGDSRIYLDADVEGGLCDVSADLWMWLSQNPLTPGIPTSPGDPATWKGTRAEFGLDDLPVDDDLHNFARNDC